MSYTTLTVRHDVAKKLKASKAEGESYSDLLDRLLDSQPAKCVEEWLESLAPLEGRGVFTPEERERLKNDELKPRDSHARRKSHAAL
jgi:predicted CopG family antitoxin